MAGPGPPLCAGLPPRSRQRGRCGCGVPCTRSLRPAFPGPLLHRARLGAAGRDIRAEVCTFSLGKPPWAGKRRDRSPWEASTFPGTWLTSFPLSGSPAPPEGNNADICLLSPDVGPCRARIPSYYYDRYTQSCRMFFYGGCQGNANNFETLEDCNEACWRIESKWPRSSSEPLHGSLHRRAASKLISQIPFSAVSRSLHFLKH